MVDFYTSYMVFPSGTLPDGEIEIAQLSGIMETRRTQAPRMKQRLLFGDDGDPIYLTDDEGELITDDEGMLVQASEEYQNGWIIGGEEGEETEQVEKLIGGFALVAMTGGVDEEGNPLPEETAMIIKSTAPVLDNIAALTGVVEIDRHDIDLAEEIVSVPGVEPQAVPARQSRRKLRDRKSKLTKTKVKKINAKLKKMKRREIPADMLISEDVIEFTYGEMKPGWKIGQDSLG